MRFGGHGMSVLRTRWSALSLLILGLVALTTVSVRGGGQDKEKKAVRVPWTTSRVVGSPEPPPPFKVVRAFPKIRFTKPLLMARMPGSDRLFVGEEAAVLYSFVDKPDATADLFFDLRKE